MDNIKDSNVSLKQRFIDLRTKLGKSRSEFGRLLKYSNPYQRVWEIETGKRKISPQIELILNLIESNAIERSNQVI